MAAAEGVCARLLRVGVLRPHQERLGPLVRHGRVRQPGQGPRLSRAPFGLRVGLTQCRSSAATTASSSAARSAPRTRGGAAEARAPAARRRHEAPWLLGRHDVTPPLDDERAPRGPRARRRLRLRAGPRPALVTRRRAAGRRARLRRRAPRAAVLRPARLYAEAAAEPDRDEALWLLFIAHLGPLEGADPWSAVRAARTPWADGAGLAEREHTPGPRGSWDPAGGDRAIAAYRAWAERSGGLARGWDGDAAWTPERRFGRLGERLALPGFHRSARFDLLVTAGRLGVVPTAADGLHLGGTIPSRPRPSASSASATPACSIGAPATWPRPRRSRSTRSTWRCGTSSFPAGSTWAPATTSRTPRLERSPPPRSASSSPSADVRETS